MGRMDGMGWDEPARLLRGEERRTKEVEARGVPGGGRSTPNPTLQLKEERAPLGDY